MEIQVTSSESGLDNDFSKESIADFLHTHLEEFGDDTKDILAAIDYVYDSSKPGGHIILAHEKGALQGAVVINRTGMKGYIPENILVYIAVHNQQRGKGLGKKLMEKAKSVSSGAIALHVEPNNPAVFLYEKMGFENKYLEMRFNPNTK